MSRLTSILTALVIATTGVVASSSSVAAAAVAPSNVSAVASATSSGAIDITWRDQNPDPFFYLVQVLDSASQVAASKSVSGSLSQTTVSNLVNGESYTVIVKAIDEFGSVASANPVGPVVPYSAPSAPTINTVTVGSTSATVSWTAPAANGNSITGYSLNIYTGATLFRTDEIGIATTWNATSLTNGTTYSFRLVASNQRGDSDESVGVEAIPVGAPTAVNLLAVNALDASVSLTWAAPTSNGGSPVVSYRIAIDPAITGGDVTVTSESKTITGLANGTLYTFSVFALNEANIEGPASAKSASPAGSGNPAIGSISPSYALVGAQSNNDLIVLEGTDLSGVDDLQTGANGIYVVCPSTSSDIEAEIQGTSTAISVSFKAPSCTTAGDATVKVIINAVTYTNVNVKLKYVAKPTITTVAPTSVGATQLSNRQVVITGTNFVASQMKVVLDGVVINPTISTTTEIIFTAPALTGTQTLSAKSLKVRVQSSTDLESSGTNLNYNRVANVGRIEPLANFVYGQQGPLVSVTALNGANGAVVTSTTPTTCSIGALNRVVSLKSGTCSVKAVIAQSTFYEAAIYAADVTIARETPTIVSNTATSISVGATRDLATSISFTKSGAATPGDLSYATSASATICTVSAQGLVTAVGLGNCSIVVSLAQSVHYEVATLYLTLVVGSVVSNTSFEQLTPSRIVDTRTGVGVVRGAVGDGAGDGAVLRVSVLGKGGLPSSAGLIGAVSLNVTEVQGSAPSAGGYVSVFPCGLLPEVSSLNFVSGTTVANAVITPVSSVGEICVFVYGKADVLIDVNGYFGPSAVSSLTPSRIVDTRTGVGVVRGAVGDGAGDGAVLRVSVLGKGGLPSSAGLIGAVSLNVTEVQGSAPSAGGYVSVFPCGLLPEVSSLNFVSGTTVANAVITPVSSVGEICVFVYGKADVVIDVNGYFGT